MKMTPFNHRGNQGAFVPSIPGLRPNNVKPKAISPQTKPQLRQAGSVVGEAANNPKPEPETKMNKTSRGNRRTKRNTRRSNNTTTYIPIDLSSDSISTSEDFTTDVSDNGRLGLFPERRAAKINFDYGADFTLKEMQLEDNFTPQYDDNSGGSINNVTKLTWNLASYSPNFTISGTSWSRQLDIIFSRYSRDIISTVRSKIVDDWQLGNFKNYLAEVCQLLEFYYCIDSILSYEASLEAPDRNPILIGMKTEMSDFRILAKHDEARRILKNCWFPDKFSSLIAWTYQNYKYGPANQCGNYRYFSNVAQFKTGTDTFDIVALVDKYQQLMDAVTNTTARNIISILTQTYPLGRIGNLPLSCSESVYDEKHYESYVNQGILWPTDTDPTAWNGWPKTGNSSTTVDYTLYSTKRNSENCTAFPFVLNSTWDGNAFTDGALIPIPAKTNQSGLTIAWYYSTNKFYAHTITEGSDQFVTYSRNWIEFSEISASCDTHTMQVDYNGTPSQVTGGKGCISMSKGDFQNVYFNINEARRIVMRDFINTLFYLK
jgi:hypothetical protein